MSIRASFVAALFCYVALPACLASNAHAQHVVTDTEAGKLTLDALTATPQPVIRPVFRPVYRRVLALRRVHRPGAIYRSLHAGNRRPLRMHHHRR